MGERAAHLVDGVLGGLPVRQWVLTLPFRLRHRLAYDHRLCRAVLGVFVRALLGSAQRRARALGIGGRAGAVTAIQRCGSALNVNPHFHSLVPEGVFAEQRDGSQRFVPLREPPSDVEVARLLARVRGRILRLLRRHDIDLEGSSDDGRSDPLARESPVLAQVQGASVIGRVATGPRAGQRVLRVGDPTTPPVTTGGPRHAHTWTRLAPVLRDIASGSRARTRCATSPSLPPRTRCAPSTRSVPRAVSTSPPTGCAAWRA
jgi:hypothetical protein